MSSLWMRRGNNQKDSGDPTRPLYNVGRVTSSIRAAKGLCVAHLTELDT